MKFHCHQYLLLLSLNNPRDPSVTRKTGEEAMLSGGPCWSSLLLFRLVASRWSPIFLCLHATRGCGNAFSSVQFSSVAQSCPTLCNPMNRSTPGLPVHHQLLEFTQTHAHQVSAAIQPSHPLASTSPPAPNPSQHQGLFQWVNSSQEVAKLLEFQL